jgi:hypothetical protein
MVQRDRDGTEAGHCLHEMVKSAIDPFRKECQSNVESADPGLKVEGSFRARHDSKKSKVAFFEQGLACVTPCFRYSFWKRDLSDGLLL